MLKFCFTTKLSNSHDASLQCLLAGPQPEGQPGAITPRKFSKTRFVVRYKLQSFPPPKYHRLRPCLLEQVCISLSMKQALAL